MREGLEEKSKLTMMLMQMRRLAFEDLRCHVKESVTVLKAVRMRMLEISRWMLDMIWK